MSFPPGVSATAGVSLSESVSVAMVVTPTDSGDLVCDISYPGRQNVVVTYQADGDVDTEVREPHGGP